MDIIYKYLNLPKSCYVNSKMPKKVFTDNPTFDLRKEEKAVIKEYIEGIYFEYSLKPQILNISRYEDENIRYEEIEIIRVKISEESKYKKVCELIQKYIQYPILLFIECNNSILLNIAIKKINKIEKEKLSIEEMLYTDWIKIDNISSKECAFLSSFSIDKQVLNNMFTLYEGYINIIKSFEISKYKDEFEVKSSDEISNDSEILNKINELESEIEVLRKNLKKESNMGTKVELNVKIKKLQKRIIELKSNLI